MTGHMAIAIALPEVNGLGRSVLVVLSNCNYTHQGGKRPHIRALSSRCPKVYKKINVGKKNKISVHGTSNPAV